MRAPNFDTSQQLEFNVLNRPNGELHWWRCGSGAPLLVLNGGPGSPSGYMHPLIQHLGKKYQAHIFDQPGTGGSKVSSLDASKVGVDAILGAAEELRNSLKIDRWNILGHSFGAILGMKYASDFPSSVSSLVLTGPGGPDKSFFTYFRDNVRLRLNTAERDRFSELLLLSKCRTITAEQECELDALFAKASVFDPTLLSDAPQVSESRVNRATSEAVWESLDTEAFDLKPRLPRIACATLIAVGRQDYVGEGVPIAIASMIKDSELVWFNQCGHKPWFEKLDEFDVALDSFYARLGGQRFSDR